MSNVTDRQIRFRRVLRRYLALNVNPLRMGRVVAELASHGEVDIDELEAALDQLVPKRTLRDQRPLTEVFAARSREAAAPATDIAEAA